MWWNSLTLGKGERIEVPGASRDSRSRPVWSRHCVIRLERLWVKGRTRVRSNASRTVLTLSQVLIHLASTQEPSGDSTAESSCCGEMRRYTVPIPLPPNMWMNVVEAKRTEKNHETLKRNLMFYREAHAARLYCSHFRLMIGGLFSSVRLTGMSVGRRPSVPQMNMLQPLPATQASQRELSECNEAAYIPEPRHPQPHHCSVHSILIQ